MHAFVLVLCFHLNTVAPSPPRPVLDRLGIPRKPQGGVRLVHCGKGEGIDDGGLGDAAKGELKYVRQL